MSWFERMVDEHPYLLIVLLVGSFGMFLAGMVWADSQWFQLANDLALYP